MHIHASASLVAFLQLISHVGVVRSCARMRGGGGGGSPGSPGSPGSAPTTAPTTTPTPCSNPSDTSGMIVDVSNDNINSQNDPVGTCPCSNGLNEQFYTSQSANQADDIADMDVQCMDMTQFCACDASGNCFQPTSDDVGDVQMFSFCDTECHMYAFIIANADADGLTDGSTTFTSGQQFDASGNPKPFASSSTDYLKAVSVSCNGCSNIQGATCLGPFTSS